MSTFFLLVFLFILPCVAGHYMGKMRGRRFGWLWGLLLSYLGLLILMLIPHGTYDPREHRGAFAYHLAKLRLRLDRSKTPDERAAQSRKLALDREVTKATTALRLAEERKVLGRCGNVVLYEDGLVTPDGSCALSPDIKATVQDAGSLQKYVTSRVTLTRVATIGIFALGAKKKKTHAVDTRQLYLLVETPEFESITTCNPDDAAAVRTFATQINNAGKQVVALQAARDERISDARAAAASVRQPPLTV